MTLYEAIIKDLVVGENFLSVDEYLTKDQTLIDLVEKSKLYPFYYTIFEKVPYNCKRNISRLLDSNEFRLGGPIKDLINYDIKKSFYENSVDFAKKDVALFILWNFYKKAVKKYKLIFDDGEGIHDLVKKFEAHNSDNFVSEVEFMKFILVILSACNVEYICNKKLRIYPSKFFYPTINL